MNDDDKRKVREKIRKEFQIGRARLFSLKNEKKLRAEIAEDKERLFELFKPQGLLKQKDFTQRLARLLMNFSKAASYRGILKGYEICIYAIEFRKDRARFYLFEYLQKDPQATNRDLVAYLDVKNRRLEALRTPPGDPLWAPLPSAWRRRLERQKLDSRVGIYWMTALKELPTLVMPYLARTRKMAKDAKIKNVLSNWPEIIKRHKRERK
jgi:hypothetical protein